MLNIADFLFNFLENTKKHFGIEISFSYFVQNKFMFFIVI